MPSSGQMRYTVFALRVMSDLTATIVIPAALATFAGRALDARWGTGRTWFAVLLAGAFMGTVVIMYKKVTRYGKAYRKLLDADDTHASGGDGSARG